DEAILPTLSPAFRFVEHRDLLQNTEGRFINVDKQSARIGAGLSMAWRPSGVIFGREAARFDAQAAREGRAAAGREVLWEVTRAYMALAAAEETASNAARTFSTLEKLQHQVASRVSLGLGAGIDSLRLAIQVERQRSQLLRARVGREDAMSKLAQVLAMPPT